jgi:hypothetical protein
MERLRPILAVMLLTATLVVVLPPPAFAQDGGEPAAASVLSPYWRPVVSRWEPQIVHYAEERNLDPDLVAAVIWKESHGEPTARSIVGAVGLMQLMPWPSRPSPEDLEDPWINLSWGARALAHTIRDGQGDLFYSLAAYNGGWAQVHLGVTRRYAASVMGEYARALAVRCGLDADGTWIAIFAVEGTPSATTITVIGPRRPLARYSMRPWVEAELPAVPLDSSAHATAITFVGEQGEEGRVRVWLLAEDGSPVEIPLESSSLPPVTVPPYEGDAIGTPSPDQR